MRSFRFASLLLALVMLGGAAKCREEVPPKDPDPGKVPDPELVVYTYDSMVAEGGLGPKIFPLFEKKCGCKVKALASGDAGAMVTRLQLDAERGKPQAHVVLGLDQYTWKKVNEHAETWGRWLPRNFGLIPRELRIASGFLPFDHGVLTFIADLDALKKLRMTPPTRFEQLGDERLKRKFILQDPRTSTPGDVLARHLASLFAPLGKVRRDALIARINGNALAILPGWDAAYGAFLKGEAPLVWSYSTSEAYHREHGDGDRYKALAFDDPHPVQVEGAAIVAGAHQTERTREISRAFLEFLLSEEVQAAVPKGNWMLPVIPGTPLPDSFKDLPRPVEIRLPAADESAPGKTSAEAAY